MIKQAALQELIDNIFLSPSMPGDMLLILPTLVSLFRLSGVMSGARVIYNIGPAKMPCTITKASQP